MNEHLPPHQKTFYDELKALLIKHNVSLESDSDIYVWFKNFDDVWADTPMDVRELCLGIGVN